jgi:hypothetical protein
MRARGITFDTGFINGGTNTRERFDTDVVLREMRVIRDDLHCGAVRLTGGDPDRLEIAAIHAANAGLEVWISPFTCDLTAGELLDLLADCADRAERLRLGGAEVVLLTGSEVSLCNVGFLPGDTFADRIALLSAPDRLRAALPAAPDRVNRYLGDAVALVRERFGGRVSYASLPFERVDWSPFDIVSTDAGYRSAEVADQFVDGVRALVARGKPVAITEFGCATFRGAADRGGRGGMIVEWNGAVPVRLDGEYARDETEQVTYLREVLAVFEAEGVDSAFLNTFASYHLPHRADPREDLDMASFGVVRVLDEGAGLTYPGMPWEPKAAFAALAEAYRDAPRS